MTGGRLVSVVVIFLDAEAFLEEAVASVRAQTSPDWELLLVDDGSRDGSTAMARAWAAESDGQIRYLEHPDHANRGMSAARNLGIRHARGEYVAFLDADDVWLPFTLEQQTVLLEAHPSAAMVYGPLQWWYSWTGHLEDQARDMVETLGVAPDSLVEPPTLVPLFLQDRAAVPSGILVRRPAIERVGAFEDAFRGEYEDQVFCAKLCLSEPVFAAGQCWYRYRQHTASSVSIGLRTGRTHAARGVFLAWLAGYLARRRVRHSGVWRALLCEALRCYPLAYRLWSRGSRVLRRLHSRADASDPMGLAR